MGGRWCSSPTVVKEKTMHAMAARAALLLMEKEYIEIKWNPMPTLHLHMFCVTAREEFNSDHQ